MSDEWGPWIEAVRKAVIYYPESGVFVWRSKPEDTPESKRWNTRYAGTSAFSSFTARGYLAGRFMGRNILAHRLVWLFQTGDLPRHGIDHRNGHKTDNRFENLRRASQSINTKNAAKRSDNTSGQTGVTRSGNHWLARIGSSSGRTYLGSFDTLEEAIAARKAAEISLGYSERHGS